LLELARYVVLNPVRAGMVRKPDKWACLGDERFVKKMQARMGKQQRADVQIPISHRRAPAPSLAQIEQRSPDRNTAIVKAHATGAYSYQQIAEHFGLHFTTVGKVVRRGG
jgi:DNA-directed RNA polymerase specialized sigma24 family protein